MRVPPLFTLLVLSLCVTACDDGASDSDSTEPQRSVKKPPKLADVKIPNQIRSIPALDDLKFEKGTCLLWNRPEIDRQERQPERRNRARTDRNTRRAVDVAPINEVEHTVTEKTITPLLLAQLRETLIYFSVNFDRKEVEGFKIARLFEEAEDPVFSIIIDKRDGQAYTRVNIAQGDNPMDLVFAYGSLKPVAVAQDDSLSFCAPALIAQPE